MREVFWILLKRGYNNHFLVIIQAQPKINLKLLITIPRPTPAIKPLRNRSVLLLVLTPHIWVIPSVKVGIMSIIPVIKTGRLKPQLKVTNSSI